MFELKDFFATKINLTMDYFQTFRKIQIYIDEYAYVKEKNIIGITTGIDFYDEKKIGEIKYTGIISLNDLSIKENLEKGKQIDETISKFFTLLFPYMRESVTTITRQFSGNQLILPIIDCRNITLKNQITLVREK